MQTVPSQDQLTRIENRLQHLTELLERLLGKIAREDEDIFHKLVHSERFQQELQEGVAALKTSPHARCETTGESLLRLAAIGGKGPSDLSTRLDDYLYGGNS